MARAGARRPALRRRSPRARSRGSRSCGSPPIEDRIEAELGLGRHDQLVGELEALVVGASDSRSGSAAC